MIRSLSLIAFFIVSSIALSVSTPMAGQAQGASVGSLPGSRVIAPPPAYSFPVQKFTYSVQWHMFNAGTSTVMLQRSGDNLHITATADSSGVPDKFYRIHDLFQGEIDSHTFCTLRISKHNEEGQHRRDYNIVLDYAHAKSAVDIKDLKTSESKHAEFDIPPCATDVISGFFYVASLPLAAGYSQIFPVNDNGKTTDVKIDVEGSDHLKGPTGDYQTLRVKVEPQSGPMKGKGMLWVWFSDDQRHIPVQMKSKLGFGTLLFQLRRIDPQPAGNQIGASSGADAK